MIVFFKSIQHDDLPKKIVLFFKATSKKKVWIPQYTKRDGSVVIGHYQHVHVTDDHDDERVAHGGISSSQKIAHKQLSKKDWFRELSVSDRAAHVMRVATELQDKKSLASNLSTFKKKIASGGKPSKKEWDAFRGADHDQRKKVLDGIKESGMMDHFDKLSGDSAVKDSGSLKELMAGHKVISVSRNGKDAYVWLDESGNMVRGIRSGGYEPSPIPDDWESLSDFSLSGTHEAVPEPGFFTKKQLKDRGWTDSLIEKHLGDPHARLPTQYRNPAHGWAKHDVSGVEEGLKDELEAGRKKHAVSKKTAEQKKAEKEIQRWLGYVKDAADKGYVYKNGVSKLKELGIEKYPDHKKTLDSLIQSVSDRKDAEQKAKSLAEGAADEKAKPVFESIEEGKYGKVSVQKGKLDGAQGIFVGFDYDPGLIARIKEIDGRKFSPQSKRWFIPQRSSDQLKKWLDAHKEKHSEQKAEDHKKVASGEKEAGSTLFPIGDAPSVGSMARFGGSVIVYTREGKGMYISESAPSIYGSRLLGHEGERGVMMHWRHATQAEKAQFEKNENKTKDRVEKRKSAQRVVNEVSDAITKTGVRPKDVSGIPEGEEFGQFTIYGGGEKFIIQKDKIWYLMNNGSDGADWSQNNVKTGGAGAVGWYVPYNEELANKIRSAYKGLLAKSMVLFFI